MNNNTFLNLNGTLKIDRKKYFSKHDVIFERPIEQPYDGIALGNGNLGSISWQKSDEFKCSIGKNNTWDDVPESCQNKFGTESTVLRHCGELLIQPQTPAFDWMYQKKFESRLNLYEAVNTLYAETPFSKIKVKDFISREYKTKVLRYSDEQEDAVVRKIILRRWGSRDYKSWYHSLDQSADTGLQGTKVYIKDQFAHVSQKTRSLEFDMCVCVVGEKTKMKIKNSHEIEITLPKSKKCDIEIYLCCLTSEETKNPGMETERLLKKASNCGFAKIYQEHCRWWENFWSKSFIHLTDDYLENLWYLNFYYAGSSAGDTPPHFINGMWNFNRDIRAWGHLFHWNTQSYIWPLHAAGHGDLADGFLNLRAKQLPDAKKYAKELGLPGLFFSDVFNRKGQQLIDSTRKEMRSVTVQTAMLFIEHFEYNNDVNFLKEKCFPLVEGSVELYLELFELGSDNKYHIKSSRGYESQFTTSDTAVDIAHAVEIFNYYIKFYKNYGVGCKNIFKSCKQILDAMAEYPICRYRGKNIPAVGFNVKDGKAVHFGWTNEKKMQWVFEGADFAPVFPCSQIDIAKKNQRIFRALENVLKMQKMTCGHTPGMPAMARLGMVDELQAEQQNWIENYQQFNNGMFYYCPAVRHKQWDKTFTKFKIGRQDSCSPVEREAGFRDMRAYNLVRKDKQEIIRMPKTPFAHFGCEAGGILACGVNEMLLQSHRGYLHVFPAVDDKGVFVFELEARGGFKVISEKHRGIIPYVHITSQFGKQCRIVSPWGKQKVCVYDLKTGAKITFHKQEKNIIEFNTVEKGNYIFCAAGVDYKKFKNSTLNTATNNAVKIHGEQMLGNAKNY